jgi:hypothetical protein
MVESEVRRSSRGLLLINTRADIVLLDKFAVLGREVLVHEDRLHFLPLV